MLIRTTLLVLCLCRAVECACQNSMPLRQPASESSRPPNEKQNQDIPTHMLKFEGDQLMSNVLASPLIALPTQCTANGTMYLDMLDPSDPSRHSFVGITESTSQVFSTAAISDLHDITIIGVSVSPSLFGIMVQASKGNNSLQDQGSRRGDSRFFIARFDLSGLYKGSVDLPLVGSVIRFAIFPSGEFLVMSLDTGQISPKLTILNADGEVLHVVKNPNLLDQTTSIESNGVASSTEATDLLGSILLLPFKEDILMWRAGSVGPITAIQNSGSEHEIPIATPDGYVLSDIVPSSQRLIVHLRPENAKVGTALNLSEYAYYEVNPSDGNLISKLLLRDRSIGTIGCEHDGDYISFHSDKNERLIRSVSR